MKMRANRSLGFRGVLCIAIWMSACGTSSAALEADDPSTEPAQQEVAALPSPPAEETSRPSTESPTPEAELAIGMTHAPWAQSRDARARNEDALRAHRRRDFADAIRQWRGLLDDVPSYDMARFNLACALAQTNELAAARDALRVVLHHDLPRFEERVSEDDDLLPLQQGPTAELLRNDIAAIRIRYTRALSEGVTAVLRHHQQRGPAHIAATLLLGVYLHSSRRFVPFAQRRAVLDEQVGPPLSLFAAMAAGTPHVLVVQSGFIPNHGIHAPKLTYLRALDLETHADRQVRDRDYGQILEFEACSVHGGFRYRARNPDGWFRYRSIPSGTSASERQECLAVSSLSEEDLAWLQHTHRGYSVAGSMLETPDGAVRLPQRSEVDSIVVHSDGDVVVLASHSYRSGAVRHRVLRVEVSTGNVESLHSGAGRISLRLGRDDAVYLQLAGLGRPVLRRDIDNAEAELEPTFDGMTLF